MKNNHEIVYIFIHENKEFDSQVDKFHAVAFGIFFFQFRAKVQN